MAMQEAYAVAEKQYVEAYASAFEDAMARPACTRLPWEETTRECNTAYAYIADFEAHRQTLCFVAATCVYAVIVGGYIEHKMYALWQTWAQEG